MFKCEKCGKEYADKVLVEHLSKHSEEIERIKKDEARKADEKVAEKVAKKLEENKKEKRRPRARGQARDQNTPNMQGFIRVPGMNMEFGGGKQLEVHIHRFPGSHTQDCPCT